MDAQLHSTYRGWTIWGKDIRGMYRATKVGCLSLRADTLAGLRELVKDNPDGI